MPTYTLTPYAFPQEMDNNGTPLAGGLLYTYAAGTTTAATTYSTATGTPNANPIVLDSAGRYVVYLDALSYKFILKDSTGVTIKTQDNVTSTGAGAAGGLGEIFSFGGDPNAGITTTSYPSGATFDMLHPGTAVFSEDSANLVGTYVIQATGKQDTSGTLTVAIVNLSDGAPDTPLATLTITSLTGALGTSGAITFGAAGVAKSYGIKSKVSANTGFAYGIHLVRTA